MPSPATSYESRGRVVRRRLLTIPRLFGLFLAVTVTAPLLLAVTGAVDGLRSAITHRPWVATRLLIFLWVYLAVESATVIALGATWVAALPRRSWLLTSAYGLQRWFAVTLLSAVQRIFGLTLEVRGAGLLRPGPIIVAFRHASIIDNLLPPALIAAPNKLRLRWILKRELLSDPALDIGGKRLPNYFVDRTGGDELDAIGHLAADLGPDEGIVIYPEGTRFTPRKRRRALERVSKQDSVRHARVQRLHHVLPPRPGGMLALWAAAGGADLVIGAHTGLGGFATVGDIWRGDIVGRRVLVEFWRVAREQIPDSPAEQVEWLDAQWQIVDDWIEANRE